MHLERRESMDVDPRRGLPDGPANLDVRLAREARLDAALHAYFGRAAIPGFARPPGNLVERQRVRSASKVFAELALGKRTELAFEVADVGVIDVARHHIRNHVAAHVAA